MIAEDPVRERTIHRTLQQKARLYGNRPIFYYRDIVFGFKDLDRQSDRVAAGLQALGLGKGDKVAILMNNRPEFLFLWFGLCKLGAVEVPINTAHRGDLLTYMLDQADCRMAVVESPYLERLGAVLPDLPRLERIVVLNDPGEPLPILEKPALLYQQITDNDGRYREAEVFWSDPFIIMFTSGTTGPSKGSLMPHNYALYMGELVSRAAEYDERDCLYNALPLFHGNAQLLSTMPALMSGARMVLAERFSAGRFWEEIKRYGCTEFNYIGGILPILMKAEPRPDDADNPLRVMLGGGAPMDLFDRIEKRFGVTLIEGYGMSEIGLPLMNTLKDRKPGTCGRAWSDYQVKLVDDGGREVGPQTPGELLIRPAQPYCMLLEYYRLPEKTVEAWGDLWFHTGDYLLRDEDGYFHFVDRKKDALRRRGENISSYEVEKVINSHPAVLESAAVAAKSELGEDEVLVCLTLKPGGTLSPVELMDYCQERMAYFMMPRYLRFLEALPKTPTQRVQKYQLREEGVPPGTWDREQAGYKLKR
ncbi:MAG: AMP-binding protein [Deltaproteobacteria bacterium]|nr:AMP-binding protein [Deltaproteobacteria bacterium]